MSVQDAIFSLTIPYIYVCVTQWSQLSVAARTLRAYVRIRGLRVAHDHGEDAAFLGLAEHEFGL